MTGRQFPRNLRVIVAGRQSSSFTSRQVAGAESLHAAFVSVLVSEYEEGEWDKKKKKNKIKLK